MRYVATYSLVLLACVMVGCGGQARHHKEKDGKKDVTQDVPAADLSAFPLPGSSQLALGGGLFGRLRNRNSHCCPPCATATAQPTTAQPAAAPAAVSPDVATEPAPAPSVAEPAAPVDPAAAEKQRRAAAIYERNIAKLPEAEAALARKQQICPVMEKPLGSMGKPVKVAVAGRQVFICCEGCREELLTKTAETLKKLPPGSGPSK